LTLAQVKSRLHVELLAIAHVLAVELVNSLLSACRTVFMVVFVLSHEANEGKVATNLRVFLLANAFNAAEGLEKSTNLLVGIVFGIILHIQVVCNSSDVLPVLGLVRDSDAVRLAL